MKSAPDFDPCDPMLRGELVLDLPGGRNRGEPLLKRSVFLRFGFFRDEDVSYSQSASEPNSGSSSLQSDSPRPAASFLKKTR